MAKPNPNNPKPEVPVRLLVIALAAVLAGGLTAWLTYLASGQLAVAMLAGLGAAGGSFTTLNKIVAP